MAGVLNKLSKLLAVATDIEIVTVQEAFIWEHELEKGPNKWLEHARGTN